MDADRASGQGQNVLDQMCRVCDDFKDFTGLGKLIQSKGGKNAKQPPKALDSDDNPYTPYPCPADSAELGNSSWNFIHTTAAYYPEKPSAVEKKCMEGLIDALVHLYPCKRCARHLAEDVVKFPPDTSSNTAVSKWFCDMHNRVNAKLGKPGFDCSTIMERYKTGTPGTDCYIDMKDH